MKYIKCFTVEFFVIVIKLRTQQNFPPSKLFPYMVSSGVDCHHKCINNCSRGSGLVLAIASDGLRVQMTWRQHMALRHPKLPGL